MKISKLFHWLYATLMFLPLLMFIPSCIYYGFNEHAVTNNKQVALTDHTLVHFAQIIKLPDSITTNTTFATFTYDSTNITVNVNVNSNTGGSVWQSGLRLNNVSLTSGDIYLITFKTNYAGTLYNQLNGSLQYNNTGVERYLRLQKTDGGTAGLIGFPDNITGTFDVIDLNIFNLTYMFGAGSEPSYTDFRDLFSDSYYSYNVTDTYPMEVPTGETITVVDNTTNINYAWESIWNLPVFAWTKNSFVSAPFTFITGLFGLQANNSLNFVFTYFCSISICWLVFDLLMYVPNLVHRWLDKGAID